MKYTLEVQNSYVSEPIRARFAMVISILNGMLYSTKRSMIEQAGGYDKITFEMFCRVYNEHPGDYGICFEYALHNSIRARTPSVYDKLSYVMEQYCKLGSNTESILFGAEKGGAQSILETAKSSLTDNSKLLPGTQARPTFLKRHIDNIAQAMRSSAVAQTFQQALEEYGKPIYLWEILKLTIGLLLL